MRLSTRKNMTDAADIDPLGVPPSVIGKVGIAIDGIIAP
jgi:hypothetical protein